MTRLTVVVAEDHYLVRAGICRALEEDESVEVVCSVGDALELEEAVARLLPDVVVTDIRMPPDGQLAGITAARAIRARHPGTGIVVLSQYADPRYTMALLADGNDGIGYLLKERVGDPRQLSDAVRVVAQGGSVIDAAVVGALVTRASRQPAESLRDLTDREMDVLRLMAEGATNAGIAESIHVSESSVEKYTRSMFLKLGLAPESNVNRRVAAVLRYLDVNSRPDQGRDEPER